MALSPPAPPAAAPEERWPDAWPETLAADRPSHQQLAATSRRPSPKRRPPAAVPSSPPAPQQGPRSLSSLSLARLACHVRELVDCGAAPHLPPEHRAALLAAARRRCELTDDVLCALAGDELEVLDVSGATRLSSAALEALLPRLPRLEAADLMRCNAASASVLRSLAAACPGLVELRLGGDAACDAAASCLADLLPRLPRPNAEADDWEAAAEGAGDEGAAAFRSLRLLIWPGIPRRIAELIQRRCPKVAVNPAGRDGGDAHAADAEAWAPVAPLAPAALAGARGGLCGAGDPHSLACPRPPQASGSGRPAAAAAAAPPCETMHIAERFRAAYLSQAASRRAREQRAAEREHRAVLRCESAAALAAAAALSAWLDGADEGGGGA